MLQLSLWVATLVNSNLVPVVSLLGVVGNALNVAVFFRQGLRERVNVCLFSLALADLAVCTSLLPALRVRGGERSSTSLLTRRRFASPPLFTFVMTKLVGGWHWG